MGFGDAIRSGSGDGATVTLTADTGAFNAKVEAAERQWRESVGQMSRESLKLDLAQDRLKKSLANYGAESNQAKRATIGLKDAEEQARRAADRTTREFREQERQLGRMTRGALAGTGALRSLGRTLAFASGGFLVGGGFVYALRSAVTAAAEAELVLGQTKVALEATGLSWGRYADRINTVIKAQSKLGFDDEKLLKTFSLFVRRTKDVEEALTLNALAADVARGRYIDLEQASTLVLKASIGQAGALRRLGIDAKQGASSVELLRLLTEKYAGAAEKAATSTTGATQRLAVEWENAKEIIGAGLLPAVSDLADQLSEYLGDAENQRRLQQQVNDVVKDGAAIVRGFAGALRTVKDVADPVIDAMGGLENAVKAATLVWVAFKLKAIAGFVGTALASRRTSVAMIADATAAGRAWDIATRPRNMIVTTTGGGVPGGGVPGGGPAAGRPSRPGSVRDRIGQYGNKPSAPKVPRISPGVGGGAVAVAALLISILGPDWLQGDPLVSDAEINGLMAAAEDGRLTLAAVKRLEQEGFPRIVTAQLREIIMRRRRRVPPAAPERRGQDRDTGTPGLGNEGARSGGGGRRRRGPTLADLELNLARPGNESADLRALRAYYARQIRSLESRKTLTAAQKEKLRGLYGDIANVQSQLDAITEEGERRSDEQRARAAERRAAARERARRRAEAAEAQQRRVDAFYGARRTPHRVPTVRPEGESGGPGVRRSGRPGQRTYDLEQVDRRHEAWLATLRSDVLPFGRAPLGNAAFRKRWAISRRQDERFTIERILSSQFNFLTELRSTLEQFGGNITLDGGQIETQNVIQTHLQRQLVDAVRSLASGAKYPAAGYAGVEYGTAFDGYAAAF